MNTFIQVGGDRASLRNGIAPRLTPRGDEKELGWLAFNWHDSTLLGWATQRLRRRLRRKRVGCRWSAEEAS